LENLLKKEVDKVETFILDCSRDQKRISKEDVRNFYYGRDKFKNDFFYHFDDFTNKRFSQLAETTKKPYLLLRKQLMEYSPELKLQDLDYNFFDDFFQWLKAVKETGNSGLATRRKNLVAVLEEFVKRDLLRKNYCKQIKRFPENFKTVFLSPVEVKKFKEADLTCGRKTAGLEFSRDLYLFGCYTGLRYSDIMQLEWSNIKEDHIAKVQQKTKREVITPILPEARKILNHYKYGNKEGRIFTYRANATINRDLKDIADKSKIKKVITFHSSRHTFGSVLAQHKVSPFYIAHVMGHTDVRMTSRYVNSNAEILGNIMKTVSFSNLTIFRP
jgi:integrase